MTGNISHRAGALLQVAENRVGSYSVELLRQQETLPKTVGFLGKDRYSFHGASGPFSVAGYFDALRLELGAHITAFDIDLGVFYGTMDDGIAVDFDLGFVVGQVRLAVHGESELWFHPRLDNASASGSGSRSADGGEVCVPKTVQPVRLVKYPRMK